MAMFERSTSPSFYDLFMAVFFGALAAMLVHDGLTALWLRYELYQLNQVTARISAAADADLRAARDKAQRDIDEAQLVRADEAERARAAASARALAARLERERQERKEVAWGRFYAPSAACKIDSSTMVCANEYMAAKKRFEASYVDR